MHYLNAAIPARTKFVDKHRDEYESFIRDKQRIAVEFSQFVRERVDYLKRNNGMSDSVLRYMEKKRRPFGKEVDCKLLFVYREQFSETMGKPSLGGDSWTQEVAA